MTRESVLIALGVVIALTPYFGLPLSLLGILLPVLGLVVAAIGATLRVRQNRIMRESTRVVPVYETPEA